jgi:signal transduction histidine kinase
MRSIRFKLALLMGGAALLAVLAAGSLVLALRAMDAALDRAVAAQGRLDGLAEVSGRLSDYGLAAIDSANAERADRPREARARVEASLNGVARALTEAVATSEGDLRRTEVAGLSRPLAQLRASFNILDRQIAQSFAEADAARRGDLVRGALNVFAATSGPTLSFLIEAERRGVETTRTEARRLSERLRLGAILAALGALAAAAASYRAIARPLLARLAEIRAAAGAIGSGELDRRLAVHSRDELGLVIAALNRMTARLARRERRITADRAALETTVAERTADLSAANERLSAVDRSRRRFFADVSHELRTPLTVILGECDIALRAPTVPEDRARSVFGVIARRAQRLHHRVEDLLRVARSESGEIELDFRRVALRPLLAAAVDSAEVAARRKGVALRLDLDAPEAEATADGEWIRQIVEGLIDNALRHASGATVITVTLGERNGAAAITVADDGVGFPLGNADELLTRFARRARPGDAPGFGLGLALAQWVVEKHGGAIRLEAGEDGRGARVAIELPPAQAGEMAA